jgi:predicted lipid carrier protein YhbT
MAQNQSFALPSLPVPLLNFVRRLPWQPPSLLLAMALQRLLWPRLRESQRQELANAVVAIEVDDLGLRCRVWLTERGFAVAPAALAPRVSIRASSASYLRLLKGQEDPDRLFFERALVLEGDTEYGLLLKNTLDALGPILVWPQRA